jgi:spoIIIJ-associated protein
MDQQRNSNSMPDNPRSGGEYQARSVDEAVQKALRELGLSRDEVDVEIIRPGSRGLLGLLGEEAVVRVTARSMFASRAPLEEDGAPAEPSAQAAAEQTEDSLAVWPEREAPATGEQPSAEVSAAATEDVARFGVETLQSLLDHMGLSAHVTREDLPAQGDAEPAAVLLNITGPDLGVLIGRQGETLRDLQFVTSLIVSRHTQRWPNLVVDVEHYKSRRQKSLVDLAKRMADRVRISGQPVSLEPMPPHERRFVHLALRDDPDVFTESTGQDEKRKVVIMPKK